MTTGTTASQVSLSADDPSGEFRRDVLEGLSRPSGKFIPGKYIWDEEGSRLFDEITRSSSYYPMAAEMALLNPAADVIADTVGPHACIVEFGSGASHKIRVLLDSLNAPRRYVAIDISGAFLEAAAGRIQHDYPQLEVMHVCADYSRDLPPLPIDRSGQILGFLPGTSIGNMEPQRAKQLLARIAAAISPARLVIGIDPNRDPTRLMSAYGSPLMARLHENVLTRLVRELGADLSPRDFRHEARVLDEPPRVEAHVIAQRPTSIGIDAQRFKFEEGESIRTDVSWKLSPERFEKLALAAGWRVERRWCDAADLFCLYLLRHA